MSELHQLNMHNMLLVEHIPKPLPTRTKVGSHCELKKRSIA